MVLKSTQDLSLKKEYNITVENVSLRLLINKYKTLRNKDFFLLTPHTHLYTELFVCFSGEISIHTESGIVTLTEGDAVIIPADIPHYNIDFFSPVNWYSIGFFITKKANANSSDLFKILNSITKTKQPTIFKNATEICQWVAQVTNSLYNADDLLTALEFITLLTKLALTKVDKIKKNEVPETRMPDIYRMSWFEDFIANRFYEPLTTSKVAAMLHISTRHLSRIIKERYGMTFHELLIEERLKYAAKLLLSTDDSVNAIIKQVGYSKNSSFYKDFAAQYGMTPTQYRNNF